MHEREHPRGLRSPWVLIYSLGITELVSWGVLVYAFAVLLVPMRDDLGWSDAELSGAYGFGVVVSGFASVAAGRWMDRHGTRGLMTAGSVLAVLFALGWSRVHSLPAFYALFAVAGLAMAGTLYEPAFATAAAWFDSGRAKAVLVLTVFGGLASVVFAPLTGVLVDSLGWRDSLLVLAAIVAVVCLPVHALLLRTPGRGRAAGEHAAEPGADRGRVMRLGSFRWLAVALSVSTAARVAIAVHVIAYLTTRGYTLRQATLAGGAIGLFQVVGRATATALGGVIPAQRVYSLLFVLQGASLALPLLTSGHGAGATAAIGAFVVLYGLAFGLPELIRGVSVADYYGTTSYASINGVLGFFVTMGRAIGPAAAGVAITLLGGYTLVLVTAGAAALGSAAALLAADRAHAREELVA